MQPELLVKWGDYARMANTGGVNDDLFQWFGVESSHLWTWTFGLCCDTMHWRIEPCELGQFSSSYTLEDLGSTVWVGSLYLVLESLSTIEWIHWSRGQPNGALTLEFDWIPCCNWCPTSQIRLWALAWCKSRQSQSVNLEAQQTLILQEQSGDSPVSWTTH